MKLRASQLDEKSTFLNFYVAQRLSRKYFGWSYDV